MKKFLILSDIHACDINPASSDAPSYVSSFNATASASPDPITELERLILDEGHKPDYVLCAGDITNRSNPGSLSYAWERLNKISERFGAKLIATVGNHDLDSRYKSNKFDPRGYAMSLNPRIPINNRNHFLEFWAENFTLIHDDGCNIVVLNTAAYHGGGESVAAEIEHGRISDITLAAIKGALKDAPKVSVNILLCHHHPIKGDKSDHELIGQTRGGEKLVDALGGASGHWIIIHGHKHEPDLFYGHGGANAPVILGCASFSAQVNLDAQNKNPNQVHLLVCEPESAESHGLTSAGHVVSWVWQQGVGWRKAHGAHGLPQFAGFGFRGSIEGLADQVDQLIQAAGASQVSWQDAVAGVPLLQRLIPSDFSSLERALSDRGISILMERDGSFAQVGRRP